MASSVETAAVDVEPHMLLHDFDRFISASAAAASGERAERAARAAETEAELAASPRVGLHVRQQRHRRILDRGVLVGAGALLLLGQRRDAHEVGLGGGFA